MNQIENSGLNNFQRWVLISLSLTILVIVYLFQNFQLGYNLGEMLNVEFSDNTQFIINKTARVLVNDNAAILFIWAAFVRRDLVRVAFIIQLFELFLLLPIYFFFKLTFEGTSEISSPILAQFHRLIVNPTLMILLVFGYLYQRYRGNQKSER